MPTIPTILKTLNTAVLSDTLDSLGLMQQAMKPFIRPLDDTLQLIGRARTGLYMPVYAPPAAGENPYEVEIALVDELAPGDVAVLACDGPTERIAPWGELLSTASMARGAAGCVTDGLVRDVKQIRAMRFPVFCGGIGPLDTKGRARMVERDVPVLCAGVERASGRPRCRRCRWCGRHPARRGAGSRSPRAGKGVGRKPVARGAAARGKAG